MRGLNKRGTQTGQRGSSPPLAPFTNLLKKAFKKAAKMYSKLCFLVYPRLQEPNLIYTQIIT